MKRATATVHHIPVSEARKRLDQLLRRVHSPKQYFMIEEDGVAVAGLMNANELEDDLELQDPKLKKQIERSYQDYKQGRARDVGDFLAELRAETGKRAKRS